jgi:hypothetical protein
MSERSLYDGEATSNVCLSTVGNVLAVAKGDVQLFGNEDDPEIFGDPRIDGAAIFSPIDIHQTPC